MKQAISSNTRVTYSYRQHALLGGALVRGAGVVIAETIVGTQDAYVIKPDSGDCVHVRASGVHPE